MVADDSPSDLSPLLRVAILALTIRLDGNGGLQQRVRALATGLAERGHHVRIVQGGWAANGSVQFIDQARHLPIELAVVPPGGIPTRPDRYLRLLAGRETEGSTAGVDIVDSYDPILWRRRRGPPHIYSSYGFWPYHVEHLLRCGMRPSALGLLRTAVEQFAIPRNEALIVENATMTRLAHAQYRFSYDRMSVIPPGYDPAFVQAASAIQPENRLIVFAGRVTRNKGLRELIAAFADLADGGGDRWRLRIVGDGPDRDELTGLARSRGVASAVEFTGAVSPLVWFEHLAQASIVVLPSYIEGVPLSLIEAMALGRPVVATDVGAIRHRLISDGRTGLLARPRSVTSLRSTLSVAMSDPALMARIGREGQRLVRPLTIDRLVEATERAYRSAIAASRV